MRRPEIVRPQLFESLLEAMDEGDVGRLARDTMRLQRIGTPVDEIVREGVRFAAPRAEYGWDHSLATLTDCLRLPRCSTDRSGRCRWCRDSPSRARTSCVGRSGRSRTRSTPSRPTGRCEDALAAFPVLVDDERVDEAEALFRGLLAAGATQGSAAPRTARARSPITSCPTATR